MQQTKDASKEQPKKGNHISVSLYLNAGVPMKLMCFIWIFIIDKIVMMEPFEAICDPLTQVDGCGVFTLINTHIFIISETVLRLFPFQDLLMRTVNG